MIFIVTHFEIIKTNKEMAVDFYFMISIGKRREKLERETRILVFNPLKKLVF
jgi:hypothetical protein